MFVGIDVAKPELVVSLLPSTDRIDADVLARFADVVRPAVRPIHITML
jgi:hypothetical protein